MTGQRASTCRIRVLFMLPNLRGGGAERVVVTLLRHLDRARFEPSLAVVDLSGAAYLVDLPPDVEVIDLDCARVRLAIPGMVRLIRTRRPDLVFSTLGHLNLALGLIRWALPPGILLVGREATILSRMVEAMPFAWLWKLVYSFFYRRFDKIVCQSGAMQQDLAQTFRVPATLMALIHNPLDIERIRNLAEAADENPGIDQDPALIHLVTAGRLSHEKGYDLLIEALALCGDPRFRLTVLGEGPLRSELETLVQARGLEAQVRLLGFQKNPYPYLKAADAFVLSSRYEGFPNVVLEAMACGTPVIATPIGPAEEILRGVEGCALASDVSAEGLAKALKEFPLGHRLSPEVVEPYAIPAILDRYTQIFQAVREGA